MNESVKQLKEIFPKNDLKYYSSQISGTILGYTGALIASNLTDSIEINDSLETLINLGTKGSLYWLGNLGIYYLLNKDLDEKKLGENLKNLNNAIKSGFLTSYSLKGVSYLTILQIDSIPNNFAPLYAYPLAGMFGLFIKLKKVKKQNYLIYLL